MVWFDDVWAKRRGILNQKVLRSDVVLFVCRSASAVVLSKHAGRRVRCVVMSMKRPGCALSDFLTVWSVGLARIFASH